MTKETQTKLQGMLANTDFYKDLYNCTEAEEVFAHFKAHGLELTEEEALIAWADVEQDAGKFGAISDEALEAVVGGGCTKVCAFRTPRGLCLRWKCVK